VRGTRPPALYTIGASAPFAATLARGLIARLGRDPLALAGVTIYLPTRRAARSFGDAFAQELGGAALLPQFRALGDVDEDDLRQDAGSALDATPVIAPLRRQMLLAQLVQRWHTQKRGPIGFAQASSLARALMRLMDEIETQGADATVLAGLAPLPLAEHWLEVGGFLEFLYQQWPSVMADENCVEAAAQRNTALQALAARLEATPPGEMVIAAGSTGSIPATAQLLGAIARLPNGAVVLPGLDRGLDDGSWEKLEEGHPQFGLKQLLACIGTDRADVQDWDAASLNLAREHLLSESLRPAPTTDAWRTLIQHGGGDLSAGTRGLAVLSASDPAHEALAIALALREALETPGRTAALVTPDRKLARRVAGQMRRWNIMIDDSAGQPLAQTSAGTFLCLLADAAAQHFAPVPLLALLKHPFARLGDEAASFRAMARALDLELRGPRPDPGLEGVTRALRRAGPDLQAWWLDIAAILAPLEALFTAQEATLYSLVAAHEHAALALACDDRKNCLLWANIDGNAAYGFIQELKLAAADQPAIAPSSYAPLFRQLALEPKVRATFGQHPRLAILGAGEARLQRFDLTILGGLNEGTWPAAAPADPWFSRPMRRALGIEQPEREIGKAAHDFAMLAAGPDVLMTRALKADGAPTVPSRWLQRLEQLLLGLHPGLPKEQRRLEHLLPPATDFAALATQMQAAPALVRLPRPHPTPPVALRPRTLSVTEIEKWLRDPYAIYARHVLGLKPLDLLDENIGPSERGSILHKAVEEFVRRHPKVLPDDAEAILTAIAADLFVQGGIPKAAQAVWLPRFADAARGFLAVERQRRADIATPHVELKGALTFRSTGGDFTLTGRADRIDEMQDGTAQIVDYKSGEIPTHAQVEAMISPQLPLEAAMLAENGFGIGARKADTLIYLSLSDGKKAEKYKPIPNGDALGAEALARLKQFVARFDSQDTAYSPREKVLKVRSEGDYDHLARVREWSANGEDA